MKPDNLLSKFAQNTFNSDSSSSDEDFVLSDQAESEENSEQTSSSNTESESDSESNQHQSEDSCTESKEPNKKNAFEKHEIKIEPTTLNKTIKHHAICCVCLNEESETYDELVSCDSCGFYTHEGCYGVSDTESKQSSNSSASTEPWFCNSCLVENRNEPKLLNEKSLKCFRRDCELCPNTECGLLKETEYGKFVHIVCALYTPGIAYQNTDKLWPVVLDEIPANKWGDQICSLCENIRYSRTGVCIKCDAGFCKSYFHVTCAQKFGYLVDPFHQQNSNDPFIAYCKLHNDKSVINSRKMNYLAMIASYKSKNLNFKRLFEEDLDKERLTKKFQKAKESYELEKQKTIRPLSNIKKAKMLSTCPSALKKLIAKCELINNDTLDDLVIDQQCHSTSTITFTPEFVKYYFERETKILQYLKELENLKETQIDLTNQESDLRCNYDLKSDERQKLIDKNNELKNQFKTYINLLELVLPKNKYPHNELNNLVNAHLEKNGDDVKSEKLKKRKSLSNQIENNQKQIKKQINQNLNLDTCCSICNQKTNSHLLIDCDTCRVYYHINCLDPPLSSVPKKTKLYGWECSKCVLKKESSDLEEENETILLGDDLNQKRSKRERKKRVYSNELITNNEYTNKKRSRKSSNKNNSNQKNRNKSINLDSSVEIEEKCVNKTIESDKSKSTKSNDNCSDSDAIYIHDDESESPKHKPNFNLIMKKTRKNSNSTKIKSRQSMNVSSFLVQSTNSNESCTKRSRSLSTNRSESELDNIIESVIKSTKNRKKLNKSTKNEEIVVVSDDSQNFKKIKS